MKLPSWKQIKTAARSTTARLALSYLAIIMLMSIGFSVVFYNTSSHELGRPGPHDDNTNSVIDDRPRFARDPAFEAFLEQRAEEGRHALMRRLVVLNLIALAAGGALSYYLARRTMEPIEENMAAQAQFVSDASHELRTPLTTLQTTNEVALRKPKLSEAEARDLLGYNIAEVAKLKALTDGLLRLARPGDHQLMRSPVSLQAVASDAMNALVSAAQAKNIAIEDKVPDLKVMGDPQSLSQVLIILLDNAIKYSPDKATIHLSGSTHGKTSQISVRDEGQGIDPKDLSHIFDRFYRADQSRNKVKADGYGIGLALAKKIVHQHDGEIVVTSTPSKGSTFTIKLPAA
jgi:signal transduction histidine kinase